MIDLHTHSTVSDGSELPERIPELAAIAGCTAVALTDHDSLAGLDAAEVTARQHGITLIRGCEVSCRSGLSGAGPGRSPSMHVLVYFLEGDDGPLQHELVALRRDRVARNRALVDRLAGLGVTVDYDRLVAEAGGEDGLGRPHVARALVEMHVAQDMSDAFDRWLGEQGAAYVPKARLGPVEVATLARGSSAVAVLAHPLSIGLRGAALEQVVAELAAAGFSGIEAIYSRYTPDDRRALRAMAERSGLVATGGSDFHGSFKPDLSVGTGQGDLDVPHSVVEALAARRP